MKLSKRDGYFGLQEKNSEVLQIKRVKITDSFELGMWIEEIDNPEEGALGFCINTEHFEFLDFINRKTINRILNEYRLFISSVRSSGNVKGLLSIEN